MPTLQDAISDTRALSIGRPGTADGGFQQFWGSVAIWTVVALLAAAAVSWDGRMAMNPDGLSYLEMASNAVAQGPGHLLNSYWSPLYPALLTGVYLFHPSPRHEIEAAHFLNWLVFVAVVLCFSFFLRRWLAANRDVIPVRLEPYFVPFAFSAFLLGSVQFITVTVLSPDLLVAGFLFLAAGLYCEIATGSAGWKHLVSFGLTLGVGYYAKTPMFLFSLILMALLAATLPRQGKLRVTAVIVTVFLFVSAPLIAMQSTLAGHFSIGESGPLSYVWCVYGDHPRDVLSDPAAAEHLQRVQILSHRPVTLNFTGTAEGSYPAWYDPARWFGNDRSHLHFNVRAQLLTLARNLVVLGGGVYYTSALCGGALFLWLAGARKKTARPAAPVNYVLLAWSAVAFAIYSLVYIDYRYLGAFVVLLSLAGYALLLRRQVTFVARGVLGAVACATLIAVAALTVRTRPTGDIPDQLAVARGLKDAGIERGDAIANAGYSFNAYFAHFAGVRVKAQIVDAAALWSLNSAETQNLRQTLSAAGIKAIVVKDAPRSADTNGCRPVPGTRYHHFCVIRL